MIDNEIYWADISYLLPIAELLIVGYCLYRFARPFMEDKRGAFCSGAVYALTMLVLYMIPLHFDYFVAHSIGILSAFLVMCRTDRRNYEQKIFIAVTFFSLRWFTFAMAEILYDKLYSFAENTDYMAEHLNMWFALYVGVCLFYLLLGFLFTIIGIRCILKAYKYKYAHMAKKELLVMVIPSLMGVVGYEIMWYYRSFYIGESGKTPGIYDMLALLYYMAAVIAIVVVIVLYQGIRTQQEEKLQNELLAAEMDRIRQHIAQVENLYHDIRGIRHDMANHILTLERLYEGNKAEEARAYSTDLKAALAQMTGEIKSGNPVTDVILQELKNEAEEKKIRFHSEFYYPAGTDVNAFDVSVILNNALQNALENTEASETSYIFILSYRRNNAYMIEIRNSFTGALRWDTETGLPVTSKEKAGGHGYGLCNIQRIARKYSGDIDIALEGGEFCLTVMLILE